MGSGHLQPLTRRSVVSKAGGFKLDGTEPEFTGYSPNLHSFSVETRGSHAWILITH
jgi:hypothetical protein